MTSAVIGNSVTSIGSYAFENCVGLTSIVIPGSVTEIGYQAFHNCASLKNAYILDGVITIGSEAFTECYKLGYVYIGKTVVTIGQNAFNKTGLKSVTIPDSTVEIGDKAFGYNGYWSDDKVSGFVVRGFKNSQAQTYAEENGFKFDAVNGCKCTAAKKTITIAPAIQRAISSLSAQDAERPQSQITQQLPSIHTATGQLPKSRPAQQRAKG